jgi:hypothetical protein
MFFNRQGSELRYRAPSPKKANPSTPFLLLFKKKEKNALYLKQESEGNQKS